MDYKCNGTTFTSLYGDITDLDVDAIAVASSPSLCMNAGIALKVKDKAGKSIEDEALNHAPSVPGAVIITSCGDLKAEHLLHCVILDDEKKASPEVLRQCVRTAFEISRGMGLKSIALPALGSAFPGLSPKVSTDIIVDEAKKAALDGMDFVNISFVVCDPTPYRYYKKALKHHFN